MVQVINLDSGAYVQDALGRRVIDLDFALAQVRADAEKIYVKDPRVKGGGYYRTVKSGSGKGKDGKPKKEMSKGLKRGLQAAGVAAAVGSIGTSLYAMKKEKEEGKAWDQERRAKAKAESDARQAEIDAKRQKVEERQKQRQAEKDERAEQQRQQEFDKEMIPKLGGSTSKAEETMSGIKATNAKSKDMLDKTQAKIEERKRKKAEPAREITSIEDLDEYMGFGKNSK